MMKPKRVPKPPKTKLRKKSRKLDEHAGQVMTMLAQGYTKAAVAEYFNVSAPTVYAFINKHSGGQGVVNSRRGRPKEAPPKGLPAKVITNSEIIRNCKDWVNKRAEMLTKDILVEEARLAFSDIRKLFDNEGKPLPVSMLSDDMAAAISGVKVSVMYAKDKTTPIVNYDYTLWNKGQALERLSRHLGLYAKDNSQRKDPAVEKKLNILALIGKLDFSGYTREHLQALRDVGLQLEKITGPFPKDDIDLVIDAEAAG